MAEVTNNKENSPMLMKLENCFPRKRSALSVLDNNAISNPKVIHATHKNLNINCTYSPEDWKKKNPSIISSQTKSLDDENTFNIISDAGKNSEDNIAEKERVPVKFFVGEVETVDFDKGDTEEIFLNCTIPFKSKESLTSLFDKDDDEERNHIPSINIRCKSVYMKDILLHYRDLEQKFCPDSKYMEKQSDISESMRDILVDWLIEVGEEYKLHEETVYLTVSYIDRFLSQFSIVRSKLQLVGTACMFIASKLEEINPPELKDFVYITADTYTKKQVLKMEQLVLKALKFDLTTPTAYTFLEMYFSMYDTSENVRNLAKYLCEISLLETDPFLKFLPSSIAAAAIALANFTVGHTMWDKSLCQHTNYFLKDLTFIIFTLHEQFCSMYKHSEKAVWNKYNSPKYCYTSAIEPPGSLKFPNFTDS